MRGARHGFTLVELLVVISIIGILIGLLIPAVNAIREQSRQTACMNNQSQVAMAILGFESNHRRLPGVFNQMPGGGQQYTWFEAILPNLGRDDLWNEARSNTGTITAAAASAPTFRIAAAVCPDDPTAVDPASPLAYALLSYGVNDQFFVDDRPPATPSQPLARSGATVAQTNVSALVTQTSKTYPRGQSVTSSQTIMLGDNLTLTNLPSGNLAYLGNFWTMTQNNLTGAAVPATWLTLTFDLPPLGTSIPISPPIPPATPPTPTNYAPGMVSAHASGVAYYGRGRTLVPGTVVVATFFDGHSQILPNDTLVPIE